MHMKKAEGGALRVQVPYWYKGDWGGMRLLLRPRLETEYTN